MAQRSDLLTAPTVCRPKTLSEFNKAELLEEARARNLWINDRWSTVELRSAIQEDRRNPSANHPANTTKGMHNMTLEELKTRAMELGYHGELHKWNGAPKENKTNDPYDAEENATIPYVEEESSTTSSWDVLQREVIAPAILPKAKSAPHGYGTQIPRTPARRRSADGPATPTTDRMEQELPPDVSEEAMRVEDAANCVFKCEKDPFDGENHGLSGGDPTELDGYYDDFLDHLYEEGTEEIYVTNHDKAEPDVNEEFHETPKPDKEKCEKLARDRLAAKDFNFDTLLRIARLLPLRKLRKGKALRRGGGASFEYFLGGIYSYGNMVGVSNQSSQMPWTVKYVNSFMKSIGVTQWSSFVLFKNTATQVHADVHNMPNTDIKTVSFGPFLGGELWMHDEERAHDDPGTMWRKDEQGRPIKSIRKALWRKAGRLAALTTWCVAASATWTAQSFPVARGQDAVSLFEIGDYTKTLEVTALDYLAAEPFDYAADDHDILDPKIVQHTIQEFTPAVIWLHGSKSVSYLEDIIDYLFEHIDRGRQLALAAQPEDPCWNNTTVQKMLDRYDGMWTRRDGECDVLRVNDPQSGLQSGPIDHEDIPRFDAYMIDNKPEVQDEEENPKFGAEAISFSGGRGLASEVKSSLRRLHQNLGHPSNTDLARHLRLAGADPVVVDAHWQNGTVERAIRTWKEVWGRIIDERSATAEEANMVITAVNNAMNTLRRDSGFSPSQAVWGRDPKLPEEIHGSYQDDHVEHIMSHDRQRAREHTIRIAAKEAYFRCQNDARLRKGLLQRSRVGGPELHVGAHVFFYRKPKNNKNWVWHGPGVVIGEEGPNFWISFSGRCHLVAPEHLRMASSEELGAAFALRSTQADLEKLLEQDFGDEEIYEDLNEPDVEMEEDPTLPHGDPDDLPDQEVRGEGQRRRSEEAPAAPIPKRYRRKGPEAHEASQPNVAYMLKMPKTPRGREKALEKEIPWAMVPADMQESFKQAEQKQWLEHRDHQ
ncbi:FTSH1, partial [Symbiodinium sp. KB8]